MPYKAGYEEDGFLKSLAPFEPNEIELKAKNCTEVSYSWCNTVTSGFLNLLWNISEFSNEINIHHVEFIHKNTLYLPASQCHCHVISCLFQNIDNVYAFCKDHDDNCKVW